MIKFCHQKMTVPVCFGSNSLLHVKTIMFNQFNSNINIKGGHKFNVQFDEMNCHKTTNLDYAFQVGIIFLKKHSYTLHN